MNGIRFQLPACRQADYPNHEYAAYWDGQLLMDGPTASRLNLLGDPTRWKSIAGAFLVTNDGMGFYFYHRLSPDQKWSVPLYSACRLNDQTLRALAEAPPNPQPMPLTPGTIARILRAIGEPAIGAGKPSGNGC